MKQIFSKLLLLSALASPALAQESPHSVWAGVGAGGSWYGGVPVGIGYAYHLNPRVALLGTIQRTAWTGEANYGGFDLRHRLVSVGVGVRLYTLPENLLNGRITPFAELCLTKHSYTARTSDTQFGGYYYGYAKSPFPLSASVGCLFAPANGSGLFAKLNLGTLSIIDLGYTYHF